MIDTATIHMNPRCFVQLIANMIQCVVTHGLYVLTARSACGLLAY